MTRNPFSRLVLLATVMAGLPCFHAITQPTGDYDKSFAAEHSGAFPVYLVKYSGGDWDFGTLFDEKGRIDGGGLYHFLASARDWSRNHLNVAATWIDIDSPELQKIHPEFLVFTGSKDFALTNEEIKNLNAYLKIGGQIWGDNVKGGTGSAFDIAFHREMKRVLPEPDKKFEPMGANDGFANNQIFHRGWFDLTDSPKGANVLEHLDINGAMAIIYTPNHVFDSSTPKEHFAMNILGYLITRYDSD